MFAFPEYKEIPNFILGQEVNIIVRAEKRKSPNRDIQGKVIYVSNRIITIEKSNGKESICLVDFKTGNAFLRNVS